MLQFKTIFHFDKTTAHNYLYRINLKKNILELLLLTQEMIFNIISFPGTKNQ